jgi:hypothetical protein
MEILQMRIPVNPKDTNIRHIRFAPEVPKGAPFFYLDAKAKCYSKAEVDSIAGMINARFIMKGKE